MNFVEFPKIGRLSRDVVVTEKIDGTNGQVTIVDVPDESALPFRPEFLASRRVGNSTQFMYAGSRSRYLTRETDNFGFAKWVQEHAGDLWALGEGRHYGEWWGSGIQRGYGLPKGEKRFSLFNTARWSDDRDREKFPQDRPACCHVVPVLHTCSFDGLMSNLDDVMKRLQMFGSVAAPGFDKPEGIVIYHSAANVLFKKTLAKDAEPKSLHAPAPIENSVRL
jgi:hypothetical protein